MLVVRLTCAIYRYRLNEEKADWIIYITDVGQREHFEMFFAVSLNVLKMVYGTSCL